MGKEVDGASWEVRKRGGGLFGEGELEGNLRHGSSQESR